MPTSTDVMSAIEEFKANSRDFQRRLQRGENVAHVLESAKSVLAQIQERKAKREQEKREQEIRDAERKAQQEEYDRRFKMETGENDRQRLIGRGEELSKEEKATRVQAEYREQYKPQLEAFRSAYATAQETDDPIQLRKLKVLLSDLPEDLRPIKIEDIEKEIDNLSKRKNEGATVSAAMKRQQDLEKLTNTTIETLLRQGKIEQDDVPALSWMMMAQPDNAVEFIGGMLSSKLNPQQEEGPPKSLATPITEGQSNFYDENISPYEGKRTADLTESGVGFANASLLFGTPPPELNEQFFEPFISEDAKRRKYEFYIAKYATEALSSGKFDAVEDEAERRSMAREYGINKVQELYGGKKSVQQKILDGGAEDTVSAKEIEITEKEIRAKYPRLEVALLDEDFRDALDEEYGIGWADYLSQNAMSFDATQ